MFVKFLIVMHVPLPHFLSPSVVEPKIKATVYLKLDVTKCGSIEYRNLLCGGSFQILGFVFGVNWNLN